MNVKKLIFVIAGIIIALGVSLIVWGAVIGFDGFDGPSVVKEQVWHGMNTTYSQILVRETDAMGYGYTSRLYSVWNQANGTSYTDPRSKLVVQNSAV